MPSLLPTATGPRPGRPERGDDASVRRPAGPAQSLTGGVSGKDILACPFAGVRGRISEPYLPCFHVRSTRKIPPAGPPLPPE
ncbi:hypothetical protein EBI_26500 [Enterocytozoon bieneusi H348]|nr:hypothetical protein EBI_26500 [Enterocytozoon bieneusi H348]|eukprot:XP_002651581.1 hypothetical protein EBI_26500 [Enterocytozoon bieneusi H348]